MLLTDFRYHIVSYYAYLLRKENPDDVFRFFYQHYPKADTRTARNQREVIDINELVQYEKLEEGMPEVY
jgi:hypothetical protein